MPYCICNSVGRFSKVYLAPHQRPYRVICVCLHRRSPTEVGVVRVALENVVDIGRKIFGVSSKKGIIVLREPPVKGQDTGAAVVLPRRCPGGHSMERYESWR